MTDQANSPDDRSRRFADAFSRHGYPFQFAVIRRIRELNFAGKSSWIPDIAELPVTVPGKHETRIDFLLKPTGGPR
ncbi:MAG TPA: hypothetical protein VH518_05100, partial [Tepidisphaeraceae bacterium]